MVKLGIYIPFEGGHSQDNEMELLASLLNSLNHTDWENAVSQKDKGFRKNYAKLLVTLRERLLEIPDISSEAPIFSVLDARISFLEDLRK